ncbi:unnamed protein product [Nyctereutes procyonoides]|uniref:(raccoon dog) hypothetical protein n=1 Tax=Nyctereutes procyonoides TaxID=34880 RepID=A0A811YB06_NYCPR|nr:unnamed protein product [Nyctereutes procyonoides]
MPQYQTWEEFSCAAEKLYLADPMKALCLVYRTDQAQDVKKIEKFHSQLMRLVVAKESLLNSTAKKQSNHEMGKRHEQKSHRGRHGHGQHAHEKMLCITCHQGNTNQNHNEIPPHTSKNGEN